MSAPAEQPAGRKTPRKRIEPEDIPPLLADRFARALHPRECGAFDGGTANRWFAAPRYEGRHREVDMHRAAVRLAEMVDALGVDLDEFVLLAHRNLGR